MNLGATAICEVNQQAEVVLVPYDWLLSSNIANHITPSQLPLLTRTSINVIAIESKVT